MPVTGDSRTERLPILKYREKHERRRLGFQVFAVFVCAYPYFPVGVQMNEYLLWFWINSLDNKGINSYLYLCKAIDYDSI